MNDRLYRVLLIEDSPSDRKIYRRFLASQTRHQFEVLEAGTAQAGLECCEKEQPDCVILDYQLPDRDGISALSELQRVCPSPVIFITGKPEPLVVTEAYRQGVAKCISKDTVSSQSLLEAVCDALELV